MLLPGGSLIPVFAGNDIQPLVSIHVDERAGFVGATVKHVLFPGDIRSPTDCEQQRSGTQDCRTGDVSHPLSPYGFTRRIALSAVSSIIFSSSGANGAARP